MLNLDPKITRDLYRKKTKELSANQNLQWLGHVKVRALGNHLMECEIRHGKFKILSDEPKDFGGEDKAPAMMEYFVAGLALCEAAQYVWNASDMEIPLESFELELKGYVPLVGWVGLKQLKGMSRVKYEVKINSSASEEKIRELASRAASRCPAHTSVSYAVPVSGTLFHNGKEITQT